MLILVVKIFLSYSDNKIESQLENEMPILLKRSQKPPSTTVEQPLDMSRVATIILGGGKGTRLFPLTQSNCKPAISFGGRYRLIDIPISNSINSSCHKIFIITQFLSSSLHNHIFRTYRNDIFSSGFIELLAAEQKPLQHNWFQGTADAVRQNLDYFMDSPVDYFLILSGDQLYNMNFQSMLGFSKATDADLVIASLPVSEKDAMRMGVLKIDRHYQVNDFYEKPQDANILDNFRTDKAELPYLASMGIYLFKRKALFTLLENDLREDFGKHLIPTKVKQGKVSAYIHQGYWEDIGTIESFYNANLALTHPTPLFDCYNESSPIFSSRSSLLGPKIFGTLINNSIICEGCVIEAKEVSHSILGPRCVIKKNAIIRESYVMGNDFYNPPMVPGRLPSELTIGKNTIIQKAILDKHVCIGNNVKLVNKNKLDHYNGEDVYIRDGIIIVPRGVSLPDGFIL